MDIADLLGSLVDKSLVVAAPGAEGAMRYRMLETIHEYASERAAEAPGERAEAERAHTAYFIGFAETAEPRLRSADQLPWMRRVETELDNIRAVLDRARAAGDERAAQRMVFAVCWFWWLRNYRTEALRRVDQALALGPEPEREDDPRYWPYRSLQLMRVFMLGEHGGLDRIRAEPGGLTSVQRLIRTFDRPGPQSARFPGMLWGLLAFFVDPGVDLRRVLADTLANVRRYGGPWETAVVLMGRTHVLVDLPGGVEEVDAALGELQELCREVGDRWVLAQVSGAVGEMAMARGRFDAARAACEESLRYAREVGAYAEAPVLLARLAELSYRAGDLEGAEKGLAEAVREAEQAHVRDAEAFLALLGALLAIAREDVGRARTVIEAAKAEAGLGTPPPQFAVAVGVVEARIAAREEAGPRAALRALALVLRRAVAGGFAPTLLAQVAEVAAPMLVSTGEPAAAVRVLAAAETWRGAYPRSVPEAGEAAEVVSRARAALTPEAYEKARATGAGRTPPEVAADLAALSA
ncbi:hypothetical protein AB0910_30810 [Streptomyces sp. NPDC047002]|uniref:hypothetical protein n=1 Tax=Streptomyces sp. NPDC047002 TaxID=3155475 RepID=UPI0034523A4D